MAQVQTVTNVVSFSQSQTTCKKCSLHAICDVEDAHGRGASNQRHCGHNGRVIDRGEYLFRQGDKMHALYVVRSGTVKATINAPDGAEQVIRFYLSGDVVGLDALGEERHVSSAQALETTSFCRFTLGELDDGFTRVPTALRRFMRIAGQELAREEQHAMLISQRDAEQRMAMFLLQLSDQYGKRGYSDREFNLHMSRQEVASFLSLAVETVSRIFTQFQVKGLLKVERRHIRLLSLEKLHEVMGAHGWSPLGKTQHHVHGLN
ncbi:MAG TPA: cyclic nucleotide-binding domain-containing protein [Gammaproteobacteria bacterium]|nr:cyclic nucleotide-binding domain-containing protein [Gammaproteobacteria bacterium]